MRVYRYNSALQEMLDAKVEPAAFLHCVMNLDDNMQWHYAIYVWDTRKVVETGTCKELKNVDAQFANDNGTMPVGKVPACIAALFDKRGFGVKGRNAELVHIFKDKADAFKNVKNYKEVQRVMNAQSYAEVHPDEYLKTL